MFDKFGEMNSYTEINELAANLLQEGDLDSLKELAKENGIPDDYVEMYLEEAIPSLCDSTSAAIGTAYGTAEYIARAMRQFANKTYNTLLDPVFWNEWLNGKVDHNGRPWED